MISLHGLINTHDEIVISLGYAELMVPQHSKVNMVDNLLQKLLLSDSR